MKYLKITRRVATCRSYMARDSYISRADALNDSVHQKPDLCGEKKIFCKPPFAKSNQPYRLPYNA